MVECKDIKEFKVSCVTVKIGIADEHFVICGCNFGISPYTAYNFFNDTSEHNKIHDYICSHQDEINRHLYAISVNDIYAKSKIQNCLDGIKYKAV